MLGGVRRNDLMTEIVWLTISESIVRIKNVESAWDDYVRRSKSWLEGQRETFAQTQQQPVSVTTPVAESPARRLAGKSPSENRAATASVGDYGKWKIVGSLPDGGQAHVFLVVDATNKLSPKYALKRLKNVNDPARRARFEREIKVIRNIDHPNVVKVVDEDLTAEKPYFVTEYCTKGSLKHIGARSFIGDMSGTMAVLGPVLGALAAVHRQGVIHRDIKPANIFIRGDGTPVAGDFGICFIEADEQITLLDEGIGSKNFIAPEMESGQRDLGDPTDRTDVYSFGKVIFWMLSGGMEFSREDHRKRSLVDALHDQRFEHVHDLLDRVVVRNPKDRQTSDELVRELESTATLVERDFAPLKPSMRIRCRFCGTGVTFESQISPRTTFRATPAVTSLPQ